MNKNLVAALLVALAPLGVIAQAQPKMAPKPAMSGSKMSGGKMMGGKMGSHKMAKKKAKKMKKMMGGKMTGGKKPFNSAAHPRDAKGHFIKKSAMKPAGKM